MLDNRGGSPRYYRNALVFLTPDRGKTETLEGTVRRYLAWKSILAEEEQLNLDTHGRRQAQENKNKFDETVDLQLEEAYQWLLYPGEEPGPDGRMVFEWSATKIGTGGTLVERASRRIVADGALVTKWAPMMLKKELDAYLWRGGEHVSLKLVREDLAKYLYLPRLKDGRVLEETVRDGVSGGEFFSYAQNVTRSGRYEGLEFGETGVTIYVDELSVLVHPDAARRQLAAEERERYPAYTPEPGRESEVGEGSSEAESAHLNGAGPVEGLVRSPSLSRSFRGTIEIDPAKLGGSAGAISQEVVQRLAAVTARTFASGLR